MSRRRLFVRGLACELVGAIGASVLIWWGPVGWLLLAGWLVVVARAAVNVADTERAAPHARRWSLGGAIAGAVCGAVALVGLVWLAGASPHATATIAAPLCAGLIGGVGGAAIGAAIGLVTASCRQHAEPMIEEAPREAVLPASSLDPARRARVFRHALACTLVANSGIVVAILVSMPEPLLVPWFVGVAWVAANRAMHPSPAPT